MTVWAKSVPTLGGDREHVEPACDESSGGPGAKRREDQHGADVGTRSPRWA